MMMMMTMRCQRRISFTKESAACSAFPHQVHGPGQGPRAGECPRVHASILAVDAATAGAKYPAPSRKRKKGIKVNNGDKEVIWERMGRKKG